jgi:hypothetical protein
MDDSMIKEPSRYYFYYGEIGIISDAPGGAETIKDHPELPAKTLKEWEAMGERSDLVPVKGKHE